MLSVVALSSAVNGVCAWSLPISARLGAPPAFPGSIQICSMWVSSVADGLNSLWAMPVPADIRWISPGRIVEPLPRLSACSSAPART